MSLTRIQEYQVNTTQTGITDNLAVMNQAQTGANTNDIGFVMDRGSLPNVALIWNEANGAFRLAVTSTTATTPTANIAVISNAPLMTGQLYISNGNFSTDGDAISAAYIQRNITSTNTPTPLYTDGLSQELIVTLNSLWTFDITVSAIRTDAVDYASFKILGAVTCGATAASISLLGTPTTTVIGHTDSTWTASTSVDTATGALVTTVTGATGKTIRWVANILTTEVAIA